MTPLLARLKNIEKRAGPPHLSAPLPRGDLKEVIAELERLERIEQTVLRIAEAAEEAKSFASIRTMIIELGELFYEPEG